MRLVFIALITILALTSCSSKFAKVLKSKDYVAKLKTADEYYAKGNYGKAEALYMELFPVYKGTDKFEDLYYKYAYCSYYQENYGDAANLFKGFLEVFPISKNAEDVSYMYAYCFFRQAPRVELEQVNTLKAMGLMQTFINTHPNSKRIPEANKVIEKGHQKLELKEYNAAALYFKISQYRAAAISFNTLLNNYPESPKADMYKLMSIKAYYQFAKLSISSKQEERYSKVVSEYNDFTDRFPDSKLLKEAESYNTLSLSHIKTLQYEQTPSSTER